MSDRRQTTGYTFPGASDKSSQPPQTSDEVLVTVLRKAVNVGGIGVASLLTRVSVLDELDDHSQPPSIDWLASRCTW